MFCDGEKMTKISLSVPPKRDASINNSMVVDAVIVCWTLWTYREHTPSMVASGDIVMFTPSSFQVATAACGRRFCANLCFKMGSTRRGLAFPRKWVCNKVAVDTLPRKAVLAHMSMADATVVVMMLEMSLNIWSPGRGNMCDLCNAGQ